MKIKKKFSSTICDFLEISSVMALQLVDSYAVDSKELRDKIISFEENNDFYFESSESKTLPDVNGDGKDETLETKTYWIVNDFEFRRDQDVKCSARGTCKGEDSKYSGYIVQRVVIETLDTGSGEKIVHLRGGTFAFKDISEAIVLTMGDDKEASGTDRTPKMKIGMDPVTKEAREEPGYAFLFRFPNR